MIAFMCSALLIALICAFRADADKSVCTSSQTVVDGRFACQEGCDEPHLNSPFAHYCLGYFPDDGDCYLKPYDREDIMTCNNQFSPTDPPHWQVFIGGSNNFFMLKTLLDGLLELPYNTTYDPAKNWNATDVIYSEIATLDFIWDADHKLIHSTAHWWPTDCYYCLPYQTESIFNGVPKATPGSYRISYANLHYASEFPDRLYRVVSPGSDWLSENPAIDVYMEWTGFWGDYSIPWTDHAQNLMHMEDRHNAEDIFFRSFVMTDSAEDCNSGEYGNTVEIDQAFVNTDTSFPKHYFSKRNMMYDQFQLSGNCMSNTHTYEPLNLVFANRYFNIICNPEQPSGVYEPTIPSCVDLTGFEDQCFYNPNYQLLDNLEYVCPMTYLYVANKAPSDYCAAPLLEDADSAPLPVCPSLAAEPRVAVSVDDANEIKEHAFSIFVYIVSALCFVFLVLESIRGIKLPSSAPWLSNRSVKPTMSDLINGPSRGRSTPTQDANLSPGSQGGWFDPDVENNVQRGPSAPEEDGGGPNTASVSEVEMVDIENDDQNGIVAPAEPVLLPAEGFSYRDTGFASANQSEKVPPSPMDPAADTVPSRDSPATPEPLSPSPIAEKTQEPSQESYFSNFGAKFELWCSWPNPSPDRFEGIGFARYLASVHIVLGHMYQGGHLGTFHDFNKFGYTWVPWFFMLSGFILTFTERRKVARMVKAAQREGEGVQPSAFSSKTNGIVCEYVLHRLETLYPIYLVGICAAIATVWAIKGAHKLPAPGDVLIYFLLLQSWVPSILEAGLVYLVQCWFLSCLLFYWFVFHKVFAFLESLSNAGLLGLAACCTVLLPLLYEMITFSFYEWSYSHQYLSVHRGVDVAVLVLKYHPLSYLHLFTLGCCLVRVREMLAATPALAVTFPFFVFFSYGFLLAIYLTVGDEVPGYGLSFRLGLVSILQSTLMLGLCNGADFFGRLFCHPLLKQFGLYGYPQYIFQFIVLGWYSYATGKNLVDIRYFLLLFSTSVISWTLVSPFNGKRMTRFVQCLVPFLVAYTMLQPFWSTYHLANSSTAATPSVVAPEWWSDTRMGFAASNPELQDGYAADWRTFNPSILQTDSHAYVVARRDYQIGAGYTWFDQDYLLNKWESQIVVGVYNKRAATHKTVVTRPKAFLPCMPPTTCNGNGTLSVKLSTGPEDPRLFYFDNNFYVSVFSYDNLAVNGSIAGLGGDFGTASRVCKPTADGLIGRMYVAKIGNVQANPCIIHDFVPVMQTGLQFDDYSIVKNWLAFTYFSEMPDNSTEEALYFIHQISPHFVIMRTDNISATAFNTSIAFNTSTPLAIRNIDAAAQAGGQDDEFTLVRQGNITVYLSKEQLVYQKSNSSGLTISPVSSAAQDHILASAVHGSVNPVRISSEISSFGVDYYMSVFHVVSEDPAQNYATYAFGFCGSPPFGIAGVSTRLPLNTVLSVGASNSTACGAAPFAFVSGLTLADCTVESGTPEDACLKLSYGVCDAESRVAEFRVKDLESTFEIAGTC